MAAGGSEGGSPAVAAAQEFAAAFTAKLSEGARAFGARGALCHLARMTRLAQLVREHNDRAGLTRIVDPVEMAGKHFLDSLALFRYHAWDEVRTAVDVGSGAGFPGLVLAICLGHVAFTLIEASAKKAEFLRLAAADLDLSVDVLHVRAEDYGQPGRAGREAFDLGLARAAAKLAVSCEYVLPLVREGGAYLAQLGPDDGALLEPFSSAGAAAATGRGGGREGRPPWTQLGASLDRLDRYELPWGQGCRFIARFRKTGKTPAGYPRRAGTPARKPLPGFPR